MAVRVILQEDYPSLGYIGDIVNVKPGYARNFLLPRGIAVEASSKNGRLLQHRMTGIQAKRSKLKAQALEYGESLKATPLEFMMKTGESGKAYGAITAKDIEAQFKSKGITLNRKQIRLGEPIKTPGNYKVDIKIHAEVIIAVPLTVSAEAQPQKAAGKGGKGKGAPKKGAGRGRKKAEGEETPEVEAVEAEATTEE